MHVCTNIIHICEWHLRHEGEGGGGGIGDNLQLKKGKKGWGTYTLPLYLKNKSVNIFENNCTVLANAVAI